MVQCFLANPAMFGKLFLKLWPDKNKISLLLQIIYLNYIMNVYNKTYYIISVNLIYLTLFKENKIKTDKTKPHKTFIKFKIYQKDGVDNLYYVDSF